jgi:hypothetical protein
MILPDLGVAVCTCLPTGHPDILLESGLRCLAWISTCRTCDFRHLNYCCALLDLAGFVLCTIVTGQQRTDVL